MRRGSDWHLFSIFSAEDLKYFLFLTYLPPNIQLKNLLIDKFDFSWIFYQLLLAFHPLRNFNTVYISFIIWLTFLLLFFDSFLSITVISLKILSAGSEPLAFLDQTQTISDCVSVEIPQPTTGSLSSWRVWSAICAISGPSFSNFGQWHLLWLNRNPRLDIPNGIGPEGIDELWVIEEVSPFDVPYLILVLVWTGFVNGDSPPIIMTAVKDLLTLFGIPPDKVMTLIDALRFDHLPLPHFLLFLYI